MRYIDVETWAVKRSGPVLGPPCMHECNCAVIHLHLNGYTALYICFTYLLIWLINGHSPPNDVDVDCCCDGSWVMTE